MSIYERTSGNPRDILFDRTIPNECRTMDDFDIPTSSEGIPFDEAQAGSA